MAKLDYKLLITGDIVIKTGLHIGGSEVDLDIGGIDKEVIKVKHGSGKVPFIPGSSLKGKLRSLIAKQKGYTSLDEDKDETLKLFAGNGEFKDDRGNKYIGWMRKDKKDKVITPIIPSRLIVRDNYLKDANNYFLEEKTENNIIRATGEAKPRQLERVTKDTKFSLDMVMDVYIVDDCNKLLETLDLGFQLLKKDYLGGGGTRGSGQVEITGLKALKIIFNDDGSITPSEFNLYQFKSNNP
ncbi:MAG: type III-A CRISPR-associated RAMP protein Csm3 [Saprospiraceae bacterium]